jgi:prepilin-type N-terminal cleavage/methylation domain-containing protein
MPAMSRVVNGSRGFTLAELLVALVLLASILAVTATVTTAQWRTNAALDARRDAHAQLVAGAQALRSALRTAAGDAVAGDSTDLLVVDDTLLEVRRSIGTSIVCAVLDPVTIELPPLSIEAPALTAWTAAPNAGDYLVVDSASAAGSGAGDGWAMRAIATATTHVAGCVGSPFARASESALPRIRVRAAGALPGTIAIGASVRFTRRTRYLHYRASDGLWYLGQREWDGTTWTGTQPIAGPLRGRGLRGGLALVARDTSGAAVPTQSLGTRHVASVDVALRVDVPKLGNRVHVSIVDSVTFRVALRNGVSVP